jgi:hypothetical protein
LLHFEIGLSLDLEACKKQTDDGHCLGKPEHWCMIFTSMFRIRKWKKKIATTGAIDSVAKCQGGRLRLV